MCVDIMSNTTISYSCRCRQVQHDLHDILSNNISGFVFCEAYGSLYVTCATACSLNKDLIMRRNSDYNCLHNNHVKVRSLIFIALAKDSTIPNFYF